MLFLILVSNYYIKINYLINNLFRMEGDKNEKEIIVYIGINDCVFFNCKLNGNGQN